MIYIKYLLMVPVMLLLTVLAFPLAFVLPFFATEQEGPINNGTAVGVGPRLPKWLSWFQTPDNSLNGDEGWQTEHWQWRFKLPKFLATYVGQVGWLWRNPAYGFGSVTMYGDPIIATYTGNINVNDNPGVEGSCWIHSQGLFQYVYVLRISANECIYVNLGWNIKGLVNGQERVHRASFAFSPRFSSFK